MPPVHHGTHGPTPSREDCARNGEVCECVRRRLSLGAPRSAPDDDRPVRSREAPATERARLCGVSQECSAARSVASIRTSASRSGPRALKYRTSACSTSASAAATSWRPAWLDRHLPHLDVEDDSIPTTRDPEPELVSHRILKRLDKGGRPARVRPPFGLLVSLQTSTMGPEAGPKIHSTRNVLRTRQKEKTADKVHTAPLIFTHYRSDPALVRD